MKAVDVYALALVILRRYDKKYPGKTFKNNAGETAGTNDVIEALDKLRKWTYKDLSLDDVTLVTRCRNCSKYKKYRDKKDIKVRPFYACCIDMQRRDPDFFCKDGDPK